MHLQNVYSAEEVDKKFKNYTFGERLMYYLALRKNLVNKKEGDDSSDQSSNRDVKELAKDLFQVTKHKQKIIGKMER